MLERDRFPRFHIGESQLPWTNEILDALGVRDTIAASGFVEKWGASFRGPDGPDERYADFQTAPETPTPQTFQVLRERFDEILLRHSEKSGARVLEEHRLLDARFDTHGITLSFTDRHDGEATLRAGVVGRHVRALVIGFLLALIVVTIAVALLADALGAPQPALIASVVVALTVLLGGPRLIASVRRRAERSDQP